MADSILKLFFFLFQVLKCLAILVRGLLFWSLEGNSRQAGAGLLELVEQRLVLRIRTLAQRAKAIRQGVENPALAPQQSRGCRGGCLCVVGLELQVKRD